MVNVIYPRLKAALEKNSHCSQFNKQPYRHRSVTVELFLPCLFLLRGCLWTVWTLCQTIGTLGLEEHFHSCKNYWFLWRLSNNVKVHYHHQQELSMDWDMLMCGMPWPTRSLNCSMNETGCTSTRPVQLHSCPQNVESMSEHWPGRPLDQLIVAF